MSHSTTHWVRELQAGNRQAADELWERYYRRLVGFARKKLNRRRSPATGDEDDVAASAFATFYLAAEEGRFPQLSDSSGLWRLLIVITQRKINRRLRYASRQKRMPSPHDAVDNAPWIELEQIASSEPTPDFCLAAIESFRDLLNRLEDATLRSLALMKMEGYTNREISEQVNCSISTVERKLRRIRHEWASVALAEGELGK